MHALLKMELYTIRTDGDYAMNLVSAYIRRREVGSSRIAHTAREEEVRAAQLQAT